MLDASSGVSGWILEVTCYHGPHIGYQFLSWDVFSIVHWATESEDTNTLS